MFRFIMVYFCGNVVCLFYWRNFHLNHKRKCFQRFMRLSYYSYWDRIIDEISKSCFKYGCNKTLLYYFCIQNFRIYWLWVIKELFYKNWVHTLRSCRCCYFTWGGYIFLSNLKGIDWIITVRNMKHFIQIKFSVHKFIKFY